MSPAVAWGTLGVHVVSAKGARGACGGGGVSARSLCRHALTPGDSSRSERRAAGGGARASGLAAVMQGGRVEGGGRSWGQGGLEQQGSARGSRPGRRRGGNKGHATQQPVASPQWPVSMSLAGFHGDSAAQRNGPSPSEYYGSMAAGSIVGAASRGDRPAEGRSAPARPATEAQAKTQGRGQNGRRARPATGEGKGPTSCRAQTIRRHEGWMHLRPAELPASAVQEGIIVTG